MRFVMAERGSLFSTRDLAIRLLAELERAQAVSSDDQKLVLDFEGVENVSDSFSEEFLATVVRQRRAFGLPEVEVAGTSPFVAKIIGRAMQICDIELSLPQAA